MDFVFNNIKVIIITNYGSNYQRFHKDAHRRTQS